MNPTTQPSEGAPFQFRFVAYAASHGRTPADQLRHDKKVFPGGCMCGFICWISDRIAEFRNAMPQAFLGHTLCDHDAFDAFLSRHTSTQGKEGKL